MADVNISKYRASVVRDGSKPASPGFVVSEGQNPTDPAGSGQNHLPVTIAPVSTGLAITDNQILSGAGTVGQYIRGDGSLADFPQASGGGSSVSYYLNGSVNQGTIGGVAYRELSKVPILGAGTQFTINANGYIAQFLTDAGDPNLLEIPGGNWNFETYFSASSSGGTPTFYVELYKYDGTTFTLIASSSTSPEFIAFGTNLTPYYSTLAVPTTTLALTDRLAVRYYVNHSGRTITLHTENNTLCQIVTTFTTGLTSLNGLTAQVQNLAVGTSGTDFNIASATATHTFNLPTASATNRGALSSSDWTTFNNKQNALGYVPVPETRTLTINGVSQDLSANRTFNVGTVTSVGLSSVTSGVTIGSTPVTSSGTITLAIATASGSQQGLLSAADWTTFNNKQNALTNPVTGTGTTNRLAKFTGASTIGNSNISDGGITIFNENPVAGQFAWQFNGNTTTGLSFGASVVAGTNSSDIAFRVLNAAASSNYFVVRGDGAATFSSSVTAGSFIRSGGTSSQYLMADGSVSTLTNPVTGTGTTNYLPKFTGTSTIGNSQIFDNGTNVGIGTINPTAATINRETLVIRGTSSELLLQSSNATDGTSQGFALVAAGNDAYFVNRLDGFYSWITGGAGNTERMRLDSTGNLGLGVTPSAWGSSWKSLDISNVSSLASQSTVTRLYHNGYNDNSSNIYKTSAAASMYSQDGGAHQWFNAPSGTAGNAISFTQAMTLTSGGNLLVGTTTDNGARLQVSGTATFSSSVTINNALIYNRVFSDILPANDAQGVIYVREGNVSGADGLRYASRTHLFQSHTGSNYLTIASSGNVGIGTSSPAANLQVASSSSPVIAMNLTGSATSGPRGDLAWYNSSISTVALIRATAVTDNVGTQLEFYSRPAAGSLTQAMTITSSGNVGIGTPSPDSRLHVGLANNNQLRINYLSTGDNYYDAVTHYFRNGGGASNVMMLTNGGNVLIGTTTDNGQRLQVNGAGGIRVNEDGSGTKVISIRSDFAGVDPAVNVATNNSLLLMTNNTERMRITSSGFLKASNTGSYSAGGGSLHEFNTNQNDTNVAFFNTASTLNAARAGIDVLYVNTAPNNTTAAFYQAADNAGGRTLRFEVRSNGGIANFSANNVALSDIRTKKNIVPLESYWEKFKALEIVKFKYKDQTHDDFNIGVIAQQVEKVAPEFVDVDGWDGIAKTKDVEPLKSIYTADLYNASIKVLQEALLKIEKLEAEINLLKN